MNFRLLRRSSVALLVGAVLATSARAAIISDISEPLMYDATHYYAYAVFDESVDWTTANTLASTLAPYAGLEASLATFETEEQYSWFVANEGNFTSPSVGAWDIAWVGAVNNDSDSYEWINGGGAIAPASPRWDTTWNPPSRQPETTAW
jgi:hypothetical protein